MFGALDWAPWRFLMEQPWWLGGVMFIGVTCVMLWLIRGIIQGIWVNPFTHDWMSFNADIALGIGFAAELWLAARSHATIPLWAHWLIVGSLAAMFVGHFLVDIRQVGLKRQLGATSLYHLVTSMVVGYPFIYLLVATFPKGLTWDYAIYAIPLLALVAWMGAVSYDISHPNAPDGTPKFEFTTPHDGWRNVRLFWRWLMKRGHLHNPTIMRTLPVVSVIIRRPPVQGFLVTLFFTHGMRIIIDWVVYGMWVPPTYWWASSFFGDFCLAAPIGILLALAPHAKDPLRWHWFDRKFDGIRHVLRRGWFLLDIALLALAYWIGWQHMLQEHDSIGSWARHFGASPAYHNLVLYPLLGYTLVRLLLRVLLRVWWRHWDYAFETLMAFMFIGVWYYAGVYDGSHPLAPNGQPKFLYSAPPDGWQNVRLLWEWFVHGPLAWILGPLGVG